MATQSTIMERRTEKLDVRVSPAAKAKLQAAASAAHRSMSDFVMESALSRAEETLAWMRRNGPLSRRRWMRLSVHCLAWRRCSTSRDSSTPARQSDRISIDRVMNSYTRQDRTGIDR